MADRAGGEGPRAALLRTVERAGVRDRRVLDALRATPREYFVTPEHAWDAYTDVPIPIGHGQVTSQPSLIAQILAAVRPGPADRALEVGAGYGFQTALLARLCAHVWSIERYADLAEHARRNLAAAGVENATVVVGDGTRGLVEHAPYQVIVVSARAPSVPKALAEQLAADGRLAQPIDTPAGEYVTLFGKRRGALVETATVTPARFVPLVEERDEGASPGPPAGPSTGPEGYGR